MNMLLQIYSCVFVTPPFPLGFPSLWSLFFSLWLQEGARAKVNLTLPKILLRRQRENQYNYPVSFLSFYITFLVNVAN